MGAWVGGLLVDKRRRVPFSTLFGHRGHSTFVALVQWDCVHVDDFLVTVKIRVTVTDPQTLLRAWQARDPSTADRLSGEPDLSLTMAVQDAVKPPDLSAMPGVVPHEAGGLFASVKAEPWPEGLDPW